jgi:TolA-binding protein
MNRQLYALFIAICFSVLAVSCTDQAGSLRRQIDIVEVATQKNANDEQMRSLLTLYVQYLQRYPNDAAAPIYMYRMAEVYYRATSWAEAARHLGLLIERYPNAKIEEDAYAFAGMLYEERLQDAVRAEKNYKDYLAKYPNGKYKAQAELFFKTPEEKLTARIADLEAQIIAKPNEVATAALLAMTYKNFVAKMPTHEKAANYCIQGAKLATGLGDSFLALEFYDIIEKQHPDFADMPLVLFFTAVEYDDRIETQWRNHITSKTPFIGFAAQFRDAQVTDFAKKAADYYKLFLSKYPTHAMAKDAKISLENIGKSDNEIVESLIKKNEKMNKK